MLTRRQAILATAAPMVLARQPAYSQSYPAKEVRCIVPLPPGTGADITVRYFAERLQHITGKPMLVENKPGAGSTIASEYVARAKPDGYTLYFGAGQGMAASVYQFKRLSHDVIKDFAPITTLLKLPFVLAVSGASNIMTFGELVTALRAKGDKGSYGAPTNFAQAAGAIINNTLGLKTVAIPYKSVVESVNELNNSKDIEYTFLDSVLGFALHKQKKIRVLAVTTGERFSLEPSIPTLMESGVPGFQLAAWWGAWFPANTPSSIVDQMCTWLNQILAEKQTVEYFTHTAPAEIFPGTPASLLAYLQEDIVRWRNSLKAGGIEPQ